MADIDWPRVCYFLGLVMGSWLLTGWVKSIGRLPCDVARKINHITAFAGGAVCFGWLPRGTAVPSMYLLCAILMALIGVVCLLRERMPFRYAFLANTRKADAPHEAFYFWSSWLVSMVGLALIDLLFADMVVTRTAALLVGIGDGVAEPIGRRLGRHRFRVPSLTRGKPAERSLEGCAAVFAGCLVTLLLCFGEQAWPAALGLSLLLTGVEAFSPHGLDNLTVPLAAALALDPMLAGGWL